MPQATSEQLQQLRKMREQMVGAGKGIRSLALERGRPNIAGQTGRTIAGLRALQFGGQEPLAQTTPPISETQRQVQGEIQRAVTPETFQGILADVIKGFKGVSDTGELQARREQLLRQQLLAEPFTEEEGRVLGAREKLAFLRQRGEEFEPELQRIEEKIARKEKYNQRMVQNLRNFTGLVSAFKDLGLLGTEDQLRELKLKYPEISDAETLEEALGYLGTEIKKDKELERKLKRSQIQYRQATIANMSASSGGKKLPSGSIVMLSDAQFLPQTLDDLERIIEGNKDLFGWIVGRAPGVLTGRRKAKVNDDLLRAAQLVGKFMEGGVLRAEDTEKYQKMLPQLSDRHFSVALDKLEGVRQMLAMKYNGYLRDFAASGYNVSGFKVVDFGETDRVRVIDPNGQLGTLPKEQLERALKQGYKRAK